MIGLLALGLDRSQMVDWIGAADLRIEFIVTDADSGRPIPETRINIVSQGGWYDGAETDCDRPFELRTNGDGIATRLVRNARTTGMTSTLRITNTYRIWIPNWKLRAIAEGYTTSEWIELWQSYPDKAERGQKLNRLEVRIALHKAK
jgi:hypothetical protein